MQAKQITGTKREGSKVDEGVQKPAKRASKDLTSNFTKAVIICNASELSKSEQKTYRPNNIVVELLKKNPMRYGKVVFPKCASEDEISDELCMRFPVLKNKRLSFSSADQYGKLNFHESEKWTGRNVRRWLPGSSAMYVIFEGDEEIHDERWTKNKQKYPSVSCDSQSNGLSFTIMHTSPIGETTLSWNSNRSQRALLDILSSPEKIKIDETQRPKIFDVSKSRTLPRSRSFPAFIGTNSHDVDKKEKTDVDLEFRNNCRHFNNLENKHCLPKQNPHSLPSSSSASSKSSEPSRTLDKCAVSALGRLNVIKQKLIDRSRLHSQGVIEKCSKTATQMKLCDINSATPLIPQSQRLFSGKFKGPSDKCSMGTVKTSPNHINTSSTKIKNNCEETKLFRDETTRKMTISNNFTTSNWNHNSVPAQSRFPDTKFDALSVTQRQNLSPDHESNHDDKGDLIAGKKATQSSIKIRSQSNRIFAENGEQNPYDIRPYLVPCYMIPNPLQAGPLYRSLTSYSPAFCVPTNGAFPWKPEQDSTNYGTMLLKGNMIAPLPLKSPYKDMFPYCFNDCDVRGSFMDTDESPLHKQSQDPLEDHDYEIIPSKGTYKGGDTFVILFKQPLDRKVVVTFGETEASHVTLHNPYTIKGLIPESTDIGPVVVALSTKDGHVIGKVPFTYTDDVIDEVTKTIGQNRLEKIQDANLNMQTCSETEEYKLRETSNNQVFPEKLLPSKNEEPSESTNPDHVSCDDVDGGKGRCLFERFDAPRYDDSAVDNDNAKISDGVYGERIPFIQNNSFDVQMTKEEEKTDESQSNGTSGLIEPNNGLLLLSSIASKMKDDMPTNRKKTLSSKPSPNASRKSKKSVTKRESNNGFCKKVFILPANSLYLPSQSDLCKLRMSGDCYSKVFFHGAMTEDDVMDQIRKTFPDLKGLRLRLAAVDQTGKLVFYDQVWTGKLIRKKLRGNSVLYVAPVD